MNQLTRVQKLTDGFDIDTDETQGGARRVIQGDAPALHERLCLGR